MSKPFTLVNQFIVGNSRVIVIEDKIDDIIFALINIYNSNIKTELLTLKLLLEEYNPKKCKQYC